MSESEYPAVACSRCGHRRDGAHYNIWNISNGGIQGLRSMFPDAKANDLNFVLFSTSGVHGTYTTTEEIEQSLLKYGNNPEFLLDESCESVPDDWYGTSLTVLVCRPRIVGFGYGNIDVTLDDIPFLKALRQSSYEAIQRIGRKEG